MATHLFSRLRIRELEFKNRIFVSPICQYSCIDGIPTDWHLVHLGNRAVGGAALVMAEATAAVGLITNAQQAEQTLVCGDADAVFLARQMLRDPYWPLHAAQRLGEDVPWPDPYTRAKL